MLATSQTVSRRLPRFDRPAIRSHRDREDTDERRLKKLRKNKLKYLQRKAAGLCSHGRCPARADPGHTHCQTHLQTMAVRALERRNDRIAQSLCIHCGVRPPFWGRRCVICRQDFAKHPLPYGARRALRLYRQAEERRRLELIRKEAQVEARKLLASGRADGKAGETLRLYMGLDDGKWLSYRQIGGLLNLSGEFVRQLLLPAKIALSQTLSNRIPWRPLEQPLPNRKRETVSFPKTTCTHRKGAALRIRDDGSYPYEECGLSNVLLFGLTLRRCQGRKREAVSIPRVADLNIILARAVLLKHTALSGRELRFLRTVAGISAATLAEQLNVTLKTIVTWEESETLRGPNDLAARMVVAALSFGEDVGAEMLKLLKGIRRRNTTSHEIRAQWIHAEELWVLTSDHASCQPIAAGAGDA